MTRKSKQADNRTYLYTYKIIVGDWSNDGHNMSTVVFVGCNAKADLIHKAYIKAAKTCKCSFDNMLCQYEDSTLKPETVERLEKLGVSFNDFEGDELDNGGMLCTDTDAARLYMEMAKTQIPTLNYKLLNDETEELIRGIGYGCFYY